MKRELLSFCLGALALTAFGAVSVNREGRIKFRNSTPDMHATVRSQTVPNLKSARAAENTGIIVTPPAGKTQMMLGNSVSFYIYYDEIAQEESYGVAYESVFCDDGTVYLKNPVSMLDWNTYIKGTVTDDGIEFTFPQLLYSIENEGEGNPTVDLMADVLEYTEVEDPLDPAGYYVTFVPSEETRTITFLKDEDGSYIMDGEYMLGVTWENEWQGYGEMQLRLEPFDAEPVTAPEGLKYDYSYILADELNGFDHTILRPIGIAYDGDDAYLTDIASGMPGTVIKGTFDREANTLTIPSNQFMGEFYNHYIFMMTGTGYSYYDEDWECDMISFDISEDPIVFNYNPEENVFKPVVPEGMENVYIIYNFGNTAAYPCEYYAVDRIYSQGALTDPNPIDPETIGVENISGIDPNYSYKFEFLIYGDNKDGQILRDNCIFYNIFINGELYTFTTEDYPELSQEGYESLTDVPVFLNVGDDIFSSGSYHCIALRAKDVKTIGVRTLYIDGETRGQSNIVTVDTEGNPVEGVESILTDSEVASTEYFDTMGRRVNGIQSGSVTIERSVLDNGRVRVRKVIR